ncbi:aldose 1-epimerase family protein [Neorhizobium sp. Rsf11]|uniref:Aldose 1-epimerase family protein n=1 Tax=Neorhizobium phenanthreniclasticum TaxID=3157917 RepID=A0ABV0M6W6_9HYPH
MSDTVRIENQHLAVEVSPLGAEMQSLTTADGRSWLWNGDAAFWSGRSPILFPMVGKARENRVSVEGKSYEMGQHGFARRSEFSLAASTGTMCRHELVASDATRAVYPFEFLLAVTHAVDGPKLTVSAEVENRDTRPMPFGLGFHPAFLWPLPGGEGRAHAVTLDNGAEPALVRLEGGLVKPERLPSPFRAGRLTLDHAMFEEDAMIFPEGAGDGLTYAAEGGPALKFSFENLPNLALWQKAGAPYVCIEPWHGTAAEIGGPDDLAKRPYGVILQPGGKARFAFTVELPAS